jgi:hypothetical protein
MPVERTDQIESHEDLVCSMCWDDEEDIESALAPGVYKVAAGEWRRETDGNWRFWKDPDFFARFDR